MNKNTNPMNDIINEFTEKFGDNKVQMTFRDVKEGMDSYFSLISMATELISSSVRKRCCASIIAPISM